VRRRRRRFDRLGFPVGRQRLVLQQVAYVAGDVARVAPDEATANRHDEQLAQQAHGPRRVDETRQRPRRALLPDRLEDEPARRGRRFV